jgi:hypothetical protein
MTNEQMPNDERNPKKQTTTQLRGSAAFQIAVILSGAQAGKGGRSAVEGSLTISGSPTPQRNSERSFDCVLASAIACASTPLRMTGDFAVRFRHSDFAISQCAS